MRHEDDSDRVEPGLKDGLIGAALGAVILYGGTLIPWRILRWAAYGIGALLVVVMTGFVVMLLWQQVAPSIGRVVSRARGRSRTHPQLGTITYDGKVRCWIATPRVGDRSVRFYIEGAADPDPQIVARARDILVGFDRFEHQLNQFLAEEAEACATSDADLAAEIRALRVSAIHLRFPNPASQLDIDFNGPDEDRFWSCTYENGEYGSLDYD